MLFVILKMFDHMSCTTWSIVLWRWRTYTSVHRSFAFAYIDYQRKLQVSQHNQKFIILIIVDKLMGSVFGVLFAQDFYCLYFSDDGYCVSGLPISNNCQTPIAVASTFNASGCCCCYVYLKYLIIFFIDGATVADIEPHVHKYKSSLFNLNFVFCNLYNLRLRFLHEKCNRTLIICIDR